MSSSVRSFVSIWLLLVVVVVIGLVVVGCCGGGVVVVGWLCSMVMSFMVAEIDRSSSVILFIVIKSSSTLVAIWLSFSLSLVMLLP